MGMKVSDSKLDKVPGPGSYESNFTTVNKTMPAFSISGKFADLTKTEVPGPG